MLMQIGTVMFEGNRGASLDDLERKTEGSLADKGLLSGLPGHEWTGWSGDLTLSGKVLPFHLGGLGDVEDMHGWAASGTIVPVIRGDGTFLGWYGVKSVSERHRSMSRAGVGYEVEWSIALVRQKRPADGAIDGLVSAASILLDRLSGAAGSLGSALNSLFG